MPIVEGRADIVPWCQWDTFKLKAGDYVEAGSIFRLFKDCIGGAKPTLDTSLQMESRLPMPQHMNVTHSRVAYGARNLQTDSNWFKDICTSEFYIGCKRYDKSPLTRYYDGPPHGNYEELIAHMTAAKALGLTIQGSNIDYRLGNDPIGHHIFEGQSFFVDLTVHEAFKPVQDFRFVYFLEGVLSRGVC